MAAQPAPEDTRPVLTWTAHAWRYVVCLALSAAIWAPVATQEWQQHRALFWVEVGFGVLAYALVGFRRSAPVLVALGVAALSSTSGIAAGPATLAAVSVATLRNPWQILAAGAANFACATTYSVLSPYDTDEHLLVTVMVNLFVNGAIMGWGMYLGSRRELMWTLRTRAQRAEAEQDLRVRQAQVTERARIAREMHDVLAHRITHVSMHAGALAFREDLDAEQLRSGLGDIQAQATTALHELRGVLGVLRDEAGQPIDEPQPTYADISWLVVAARDSGMNVQFHDEIDTSHEPVPDLLGRTLYRIVQEGLTNASKHAPGALLQIRLTGGRDEGVDLRLRNPLGFSTATAPGSGLGLVGLRERADLAGGRLDQWRDGSAFVLQGWLPWTT